MPSKKVAVVLTQFPLWKITLFGRCSKLREVLNFQTCRDNRCSLTHSWHERWSVDTQRDLLTWSCSDPSGIWCRMRGQVAKENCASALNGYARLSCWKDLSCKGTVCNNRCWYIVLTLRWLRSLSVVKLEVRVTARLAWDSKCNSLQIYLNSRENRRMVVEQLRYCRIQMLLPVCWG